MQFILDKYPSRMFLFTTRLLLLVIPFRKTTNSAGPGAGQSATDSQYESKTLAFLSLVS